MINERVINERVKAALQSMGIEPNDTSRLLVDVRADGQILVHHTTMMRKGDPVADLLDAIAGLPNLPAPGLAPADLDAAAERAWEVHYRRAYGEASGQAWGDLAESTREHWRSVVRAAVNG